MSLDYVLSVDIASTPADLGRWLVRECGLEPIGGVSHVRVARFGIICDLLASSEIHCELVQSVFQINCQMTIHCNIDKFEGYDAGMASLREIVGRMLRQFDADLVLLANYEKGVLLRKSGSLLLDGEEGPWREPWEEQLGRHDLKWKCEILPSL